MSNTPTHTPIEIGAQELADLLGFGEAFKESLEEKRAYDLHQAEMCKLWDESTCECSPPPL